MSAGTRFEAALGRADALVPTIETDFTREREVLFLAGFLLAGMAVLVPAFAAAVERFGLPVPLPLLVGVGAVGVAYLAVVLLLRRVVAGSLVAMVVLATFKANVPVLAAANRFPKDVVGDLMVVHAPLLALAVLAVAFGWYRAAGLPGGLLAGFVAATAVPWTLGWAPSTLAAASFTLFAGLALVAYVAVAGAVADGFVEFRTVVATVVLSVGTHAAVGVVQFLHQDPLGFTRLGEGGARRRAAMTIPIVGRATVGPYVSGFTGMSFVLAYLVVLALPAAALFVARRRGETRLLGGLGILALVGVVRASASDAARGALLVAVVAFAALLSVGYRRRVVDFLRYLSNGQARAFRRVAYAAAVVLPAVVLLGYPSNVSGGAVEGAAAGGSGAGGGTGSGVSGTPAVDLRGVSVPFFDLSNLGIRLREYVAAVDLFLGHPAFGIGGTNWVVVAGRYGFEAPWNMSYPPPIHSIYFTLLAETGTVGLALYLGSVLALFLVGARLLGHNGFDDWRYVFETATDRALVAAVLAGLVGTLAFSVFDVVHLYAAAGLLPFWTLAGAIVGEYRRVERDGDGHDAAVA